MPDIPGVLVFMTGHVGVYIGGGYVIEARGHEYGVVKTKLKDRPWKWWGKCPWIEYSSSTSTSTATSGQIPTKKVKLKPGSWNVRKLPTLDSESIVVVKGKEINILDGWVYVPELNGFISAKALE